MPYDITSTQNQRIKNAIRLRDRRGRQKQDRIIIDGLREVRRAIDAGIEIVELFYCPDVEPSHVGLTPLLAARCSNAESFSVSSDVIAKLSFGNRAEGVVAIAGTPRLALSQLPLIARPLVAVLEGIEKPGNVGAIIRSADGAGVSAVIVVDGGTDLHNPNTIRASLGTVFTLPVCSATASETIDWLREHAIHVVVTDVDATTNYDEHDFTQPVAIVLGSEAGGLSSRWRGADTRIRLPMQGAADSLNVSAAAAVLFYEANRQRR